MNRPHLSVRTRNGPIQIPNGWQVELAYMMDGGVRVSGVLRLSQHSFLPSHLSVSGAAVRTWPGDVTGGDKGQPHLQWDLKKEFRGPFSLSNCN